VEFSWNMVAILEEYKMATVTSGATHLRAFLLAHEGGDGQNCEGGRESSLFQKSGGGLIILNLF